MGINTFMINKRIFHHLDLKEMKRKQHESLQAKRDKIYAENKKVEKKLKEEQQIKKIFDKQKYSWREELISEGEWRPVAGAGPTNATSQTFGYFDGGFPVPNSETGQQVTTTASGLGGVEATSSTTTINLGFGETLNVSSPTYDQLALAGVAQPILMKRQETGDTNKKLNASQKFTQKVGVDAMMNARVDSKQSDDDLKAKQKAEYYTKKLGPIFGEMTKIEEIRMNERLVQENERQNEIFKKNEATRAKHQTSIDNKIKPLLDQINSGSDEKIDLKTLYQRGAVVNKDGTRGLMIRRETTSAMGLSITKTVITTYRGKNISTVGSVANREKLGITGQGKMTKVAEIKDPRLIEYKMPVELEMWQTQSIPYLGAMSRSLAMAAAKKTNTVSAFNVLNYFIDNHVKTYAKFDPSRAKINHNLTHLYTPETKDILRSMVDSIKTNIDLDIKTGESNEKIRENVNNLLVERQPTDVSNSLGNAMGFDVDYYKQTGNYRFNSTYTFTSTLDMEPRDNALGIVNLLNYKNAWPKVKFEAKKYAIPKYVAGQLYGETMMAVQNPMKFQVDIESGKQYSSKEPPKTEPVSKQSKSKEPSKAVQTIKKMAKTKSVGFDRDEPIVRKKKDNITTGTQ